MVTGFEAIGYNFLQLLILLHTLGLLAENKHLVKANSDYFSMFIRFFKTTNYNYVKIFPPEDKENKQTSRLSLERYQWNYESYEHL